MKGIRSILILYVILMGAALAALIIMHANMEYKGRDITIYNDRLLSMQAEYLEGASVESLEEKYDCRILFATSLTDSELSKMYSNRWMILDFAPGGDYLGKVAWDDSSADYEKDRDRFFAVALI